MDKKSWGWYALFGALYFANSCAGAVTNATLLYVMYKAGWTKSMGGTFLAVSMLPWTWKIVMAPLVDRWKISRAVLGSKPAWIMLSGGAMVASLLAIPLLESWFSGLVLFVFLHNVARSLLDLVVDGWSVEACGQKSRPVQAAMSVGGAFGLLAGGGGAIYLLTVMPWAVVCVIAAVVSGAAVVVPIMLLAWSGWRPSVEVVSNEAAPVKWSDFLGAFRGGLPLLLAAAALLIHIPEGMTGPIIYKWFMDLGYGDTQVSWLTSWGAAAKICGALLVGAVSGWALSRESLRRVWRKVQTSPTGIREVPVVKRIRGVTVVLVEERPIKPELQFAAWVVPCPRRPEKVFAGVIVAKCIGYIMIGGFSYLWGMDNFVFMMVVVTSFTDAVVVVLFRATVMEICKKKVACTQFAVYMAVMNVGIIWTTWVGGQLGDVIPTARLFSLSGWAGFLVLIPLALAFRGIWRQDGGSACGGSGGSGSGR